MASAQAVDKLMSNLAVTAYSSGDASSAKDIAWVDMRDVESILVGCHAAALTGLGVTAFKLIANPDSAGGGSDVTVVQHAVGSAPDAVGDTIWLECTPEQVREVDTAGTGLRYLSANITAANSSDRITVIYIIKHKYPTDGLTADVIAA